MVDADPENGASYIEKDATVVTIEAASVWGSFGKASMSMQTPTVLCPIFEKSCAGGQGFGCYALARAYRKR